MRISILLASLTLAAVAHAAPSVTTPHGWTNSVSGIRVASKQQVGDAIAAAVRAKHGDVTFSIALAAPHPINLDFSTPQVTRYARTFGRLRIDGHDAGEMIVDATAGKVQAFLGRSQNQIYDALFAARGLPSIGARIAEREAKEHTQPFVVRGTLAVPAPALYAMGTGDGRRATLVGVNGHVPGFSVPALAVNPMFDLFANAWGFTRVR
jgi:hypothetical protein